MNLLSVRIPLLFIYHIRHFAQILWHNIDVNAESLVNAINDFFNVIHHGGVIMITFFVKSSQDSGFPDWRFRQENIRLILTLDYSIVIARVLTQIVQLGRQLVQFDADMSLRILFFKVQDGLEGAFINNVYSTGKVGWYEKLQTFHITILYGNMFYIHHLKPFL